MRKWINFYTYLYNKKQENIFFLHQYLDTIPGTRTELTEPEKS